ncbi:hypothetical protein LguiA_010865 [Lonicera macranthoides]
MLVETTASKPAVDMTRHDKSSMLLRPREESARVDRASPPTRQPTKKEEAGRPVMIEPAHSRDHSDTTDVCAGKSQAQELLGSLQKLLA